MALQPGARVGPYEVAGMIGEGGMGKVYRATDTNLKRTVAIKVLPDAVATDVERIARFQREAEMLARLNHPNIAQIHGLERDGTMTGLVMELVDGPTLADRIAHGPIPVADALAIAKQIAQALEAAHEQGIVHRDLKPANIKIRPDETVKVLDFGLARALEPAEGLGLTAQASVTNSPTVTSPVTKLGVILGTAAYMSPEQARGKPVDKRTDIWAFGAVFYEMLTGRRAFGGDDVASVLAAVLSHEPDWTALPADLPPVLSTFIRRCLNKDRRQRIRDIGDVSLALEQVFEPTSSVSGRPVAAPPFWKRALPIAATAIVVSALTGLVAWRLQPAETPRAAARFEYVLPPTEQFAPTQRPTIAIARDGRFFVYQTTSGLFVREMNDLNPRLIPGTQDITNPFISYDGQWIGYFNAGQLWKVAVAGGTSVRVCDASEPFGATWTRDNWILFGQAGGIMRVSGNGGKPEFVIPAEGGETLYGPEVLPDGNSVLFSTAIDVGGQSWAAAEIVAHSLSSGKRTRIVERGLSPRYLPTGHLVYGTTDGMLGIGFDSERLTTIGGPVPLGQVQRVMGVISAAFQYAIADDGTLVYVPVSAGPSSLVWVNRNGTSTAVGVIPAGAFRDPRLSPDGGRVLLTHDNDIWIYELASGRSTRITKDNSSSFGVWHPAGSRIAYSSGKSGNLEAWETAADGSGQPRQVTRLGGLIHVDAWSPDGNILTVHQHRPNRTQTTIFMIRMDRQDAAPEPFAEGDGSSEGAHFSPDGRFVSYSSLQSGQRETYVRPYPDGSGPVTVSVGGAHEPIWGKNGEVFYRNLRGDRMFAARVTTRPKLAVDKPEALFEGAYYIAPSGSPRPQYDVTADGQRFLMITRGADTGSAQRDRLVIVQNWFDELKRLVPGNAR